MIPYKSHLATSVPETLEVRLEVMNAIRALAVQSEEERLRRRRVEMASIRRELGQITLALLELKRASNPRLRSYVIKYSPAQPRVPAGHPDGGRWTSGGGSGSSNDSGPVLAQNKVTPRGFTVQRVPGQDPLDPQGLNKPISADEQQKIADALTLIFNGEADTLQRHSYGNLPHRITGAVLPPSAAGYTAYDVPGLGPGRGEGRLLVDEATGAIYYTNSHYFSFYPVQLHRNGE